MASAPLRMLMTGVVLVAAGWSTTAQPAVTRRPAAHAQLVVGDFRAPGAGDRVLAGRLRELGFEVSLVSAGAAATPPDTRLLVVAPSARPSGADEAAWRTAAVPVLLLRGASAPGLALTGPHAGAHYGSGEAQRHLVLPGHVPALSFGLAGAVTLCRTPCTLGWGVPGAEAWAVAHLDGDPWRVTLFAYERGASLIEGQAPARRAALLFSESALANLTGEGLRLLDGTLRWTAGLNAAPWVDAGPDRSVREGERVWLDGRVGDDGLPDGGWLSAAWTQVSGPARAAIDDETDVTTSALPRVPGRYVFRLSAADGELTGADDLVVEVEPIKPGGDAGERPGSGEPPAPRLVADVLLVVGSVAPLSAGDQKIKTRAEGFGLSVETKLAAASSAADAAGRRMVFLSSSSPNADLSDKFRAVTVPVVVMSTGTYDDMSLTSAAGRGNALGTQLVIQDPQHPLAATLSGTVTTYLATTNYAWGTPSAEGTRVATLPSDATRAPVFAYDTGALMDGGFPAPARRVGLGLDTGQLSANGERLLDNVIFWLNGANLPPFVSAGPDRSVALGAPVSLDGTISDDGLPNPPGALHVHWTAVGGPAPVSFLDPGAVDTDASFPVAGVYVVRLAVTDGEFEVSDEAVVVVRNNAANTGPYVWAGADQAFTPPGWSINLAGSVYDDGLPLPPGATTKTWSKMQGPGNVSFGTPNAATTTATFSVKGTYVLRLSASDGQLTGFDELTVTVKRNALLVVGDAAALMPSDAFVKTRLEQLGFGVTVRTSSTAVTADANGRDLVFVAPSTDSLFGDTFRAVAVPVVITNTGIYDNYGMANVRGGALTAQGVVTTPTHPAAAGLSGTWTFTSPAVLASWGTPGPQGVKVLTIPGDTSQSQLFAYEQGAGLLNDIGNAPARRVAFGLLSDPVVLTPAGQAVFDAAVLWAVRSNLPPAVSAGPDLNLSLGSPAVLAGSVSDDGLPAPPVLSVQWRQVSGPGNAVFANPNAASTSATLPAAGTYFLELSASDGARSSTDVTRVNVTSAAPGGNAAPSVALGPDRVLRLPATLSLSGVTADDGRPVPPGTLSLTWSKLNGPGSVTFTPPGSASTQAAFSSPGVYTLRLTASDGALSGSDDMQVTVEAALPALLVIGLPTSPPSAYDSAIQARLETLGFTVTIKSDSAAQAADASGKALVVVSDTCNSVSVGAKFRDVTTPVLVLEPAIFDDMAMTSVPGTTTTAETRLKILARTHPLAAGMSGERQVAQPGAAVGSVSTAGTKALNIAGLASNPGLSTVFAYEQGAELLAGLTARARRVGFFSGPQGLTADGLRLFDAAVGWATARVLPALLVTGSTALTAGDVVLRDRLVGQGFAPRAVTSAAVTAADASGQALIVVAPSANAAQLGTKLRLVAPASLTAQINAFPHMGLTGSLVGVDYGTLAGQTQIEVFKPTHPLAARLTGVQTVTAADTYGWGTGPGLRVTTLAGDTSRGTTLAFGFGWTLVGGGTSVDRRLGYYLGANGAASLTAAGRLLLDTAIDWLVASDVDGDGLTTRQEFAYGADPLNPDTNGDGVFDGAAVGAGLSPTNLDMDGDGLSNTDERTRGTDPFRYDTDGDGVSDLLDAFPLDPTRWNPPSPTPGDTTPPVITLIEPPLAPLP